MPDRAKKRRKPSMSLILAGVERAYELERVSTADASDELPPPLLLPPALVDAVFLSSLRDLPGEKGKQQGRVSKGDLKHCQSETRLLARTEGPYCKQTRRGNGGDGSEGDGGRWRREDDQRGPGPYGSSRSACHPSHSTSISPS
jgi:hypothetical protein